MPELKLTYFDMRGRAEPCRLALIIGDVPFEDDRIARDQWKDLKPTLPYLSLPVLSIDGEVIAQSYGILLYCGKVGGLYPADPAEAIKVDEVLGVVEDLVQAVFRYRGDDKDKMREEREKYAKIDVPRYVGGLEKRLETFGSGPWVVGDGITIADLAVFHMVTTLKCGLLDFLDTDMYDGYDRVMKSYNAVRDHPKVVEWYKKHPIKMVL